MINIGISKLDEIKKENRNDLFFAFFLLLLVCFFFFVSQVWIQFVQVNGKSMTETLQNGDILILNKLDKNPKRFDIIVFKATEKDDYIKRVIAIEGDTIYTKDGIVHLIYKENNIEKDVALNETYLSDTTRTYVGGTTDLEKTMIGKDEYFVMGDNRYGSKDSRAIGLIKKSAIKGVVSQFIVDNKEFIKKVFG